MSLEDSTRRPDLSDLEAALGSLRPVPVAARDRILFRAGQDSARSRPPAGLSHRCWPAVAAGLAAVAAGEGMMLAHRPTPAVVERVVLVREPAPQPPQPVPIAVDRASAFAPSEPIERSPRSRLAEQIARYGLEGFPSPALDRSQRIPLASGRALLRRELRSALLEGDHS